MNNQAAEIIDTIAKKLEVPVQHLWGVLIKQAPIDATMSLCSLFVAITILIVTYKIVVKRSKIIKEECEPYDWTENPKFLMLIIPTVVISTICVVITIGEIFMLSTTLSGYLNPEYWALSKILSLK